MVQSYLHWILGQMELFAGDLIRARQIVNILNDTKCSVASQTDAGRKPKPLESLKKTLGGEVFKKLKMPCVLKTYQNTCSLSHSLKNTM